MIETTEISYESWSEDYIRSFVPPDHDGALALAYETEFLILYRSALFSRFPQEEQFLRAYERRALALIHGANAYDMDNEAWLIRMEWAREQERTQ